MDRRPRLLFAGLTSGVVSAFRSILQIIRQIAVGNFLRVAEPSPGADQVPEAGDVVGSSPRSVSVESLDAEGDAYVVGYGPLLLVCPGVYAPHGPPKLTQVPV